MSHEHAPFPYLFFFFAVLRSQLFFQMESFDIKVEGISGGQLVPLLSLEGQVQVEVKDWSTKV